MTTDTPRTDAVCFKETMESAEVVLATFARQLERELSASRAEVERLRVRDSESNIARAELWAKRTEKAEAEVERLRNSLRRVVEIAEDSNDSLMDWDENSRCEAQKKNRAELNQLKATLNSTNK